jgi:glycogen debranching enzyme
MKRANWFSIWGREVMIKDSGALKGLLKADFCEAVGQLLRNRGSL